MQIYCNLVVTSHKWIFKFKLIKIKYNYNSVFHLIRLFSVVIIATQVWPCCHKEQSFRTSSYHGILSGELAFPRFLKILQGTLQSENMTYSLCRLPDILMIFSFYFWKSILCGHANISSPFSLTDALIFNVLCVYVFMCVCAHFYVCMCVSARVCVCMCVYVPVWVLCLCVCTCVHVYECISVCLHVCSCMSACLYVCLCVYVCAWVCNNPSILLYEVNKYWWKCEILAPRPGIQQLFNMFLIIPSTSFKLKHQFLYI